MIKYLTAFLLIASPCFAGMGIGGFPYPGPVAGTRPIPTGFHDTFTESSNIALTSHTPEYGGAWYSSIGSNIYVDSVSDTLKATTSSEMFAINSESSISSVVLDVKPASGGNYSNGGCLSASSDMSGDTYCAYVDPGSNRFTISRWFNGSLVSSPQTNDGVVYANKLEDVYTVSIETTGSHILASVKNGTTTLSSIDVAVSFAGGYGGVIISGTSVSIDNITGN